MRSSILIAFLVVAISSSTYGDGNIFGVPIDPDNLHTLKAAQVDAEIAAKAGIITEIGKLVEKVPENESAWLWEFQTMMKNEQEIINKMNIPLSSLNTINLHNINDPEKRKPILQRSYENFTIELKNYLTMLDTFDLSAVVWEDRSFLGNPFKDFLTKTNDANPETLKAVTLLKAFRKANNRVTSAKNCISSVMDSLKSSLAAQLRKSLAVMAEIRNLDLLIVPHTEKKVETAIKYLEKELKNLKRAIENINKIQPACECFISKRSWIDEIQMQLNKIDKAHKELDAQLSTIYL